MQHGIFRRQSLGGVVAEQFVKKVNCLSCGALLFGLDASAGMSVSLPVYLFGSTKFALHIRLCAEQLGKGASLQARRRSTA